MKKLIFCIISMVLCIFYSGCPNPEPNPIVNVFTVSPNGTDDTENLRQAFNKAIAYGTGATVKLEAGQYYINVMEIHEFKGFFKGAGKDKTFIDAVPDLPCAGIWAKNDQGYLMSFLGGDVSVSDMTFKIHNGFACADEHEPNYGRDLYCILIFADYSESYRPDTKYIKASIKDVNFIGGTDDGSGGAVMGPTPWNTLVGVWGGANIFWPIEGHEYPLTKGEFTFESCHFDDFFAAGEGAILGGEGVMEIKNSEVKNTTLGWYFVLNLDYQVSISGNTFNNISALDLYIDDSDFGIFPDKHATRRSIISITGNEFNTVAGATSILTTDSRKVSFPNDPYPMNITIENNHIELADSAMGIISMYSSEEQIKNNTFSGNGSTGIILDADSSTGFFAEDALMSGNNFSGATYRDAHIYLGTGTKNCTVNATNTDIVIDNGTGNTINGTGRYGRLSNSNFYNQFNGIARKNMMMKRKP